MLESSLAADAELTPIAFEIDRLNQQQLIHDESLNEGEEPSDEYIAVSKELLERQINNFEYLSEVLLRKKDNHLELISQLISDNDNLATAIEAANAMKFVNDVYLETMAISENLPVETENTLRDLAESCPQRYGSAVGRAQSILVQYNKLFSPLSQCEENNSSIGFVGTNYLRPVKL